MEDIQHNPIRPCPCSTDAIGCGYHNMDLLEGCPFDCSYCILQAYLPSKKLRPFACSEERVHHWLTEASSQNPFLRLGTGELADSLAFEAEFSLTDMLLRVIPAHPDVVLEWKTKSIRIETFLRKPHLPSNIVLSWSLNPEEIIATEEHGTPTLRERLHAMRRVADSGAHLGIHLDPVILTPQWRSRYERLIRTIRSTLGANAPLAWISLGSLRYPPSLRPILLNRPPSALFYAEQQRDRGGKYRYHPELRIQAYRHIVSCLGSLMEQHAPLYLCMEQKEIWEEVFPGTPPAPEEINEQLHRSATRFSTEGEKTVEIKGRPTPPPGLSPGWKTGSTASQEIRPDPSAGRP